MQKNLPSSRDRALAAIQVLDKDASFDDMMYKLYVLQKIEKGEQDIMNGKTFTTAEAKKRLKKWLK